MGIKGIYSYDDNRFSKTELRQHGAFLVDGVTTRRLSDIMI